MAFSKELEEVIEAALADGVITDKERAVLHKKALLEGVDPDELDIVIEGRLSKMKREEDWLKPAPPASEKRGNIVKCPNCGAPIQAGAVKCDECGYVFTNVAANHSSEVLARKISELLSNHRKTEHVIEEIKNFPLPTSKEDLLEFIASMDAKRKEQGPLQQAYRAKFNEAITKAKTFFATDSQVMGMVKSLDKFSVSALTKMQKIICLVAVIVVVIIIAISRCAVSQANADETAKANCDSLCTLIDALPIPTKENCTEMTNELLKIVWTMPVEYGTDAYNYKEAYLKKKVAYGKQIMSAFDELWYRVEVSDEHSIRWMYENAITHERREERPNSPFLGRFEN